MMNGFNAWVAPLVWQADAAGVIVKQLESTNAQVGAGKNVGIPKIGFVGFERQGTRVVAGSAAKPAKIGSCWAVGLNTLLLVRSGTESCASDRSPS